MKKLKSIFSPKKLILWLILLVLAISIPELNRPSMGQVEAIVTTFAIDKVDDLMQVAVTVLSPSQGKTATTQVFAGSGNTISEAVKNVSIAIGKEMGFAQCETLALGDNICDEGVISSLNYMTKSKKVGRNAMLLNFSGSAKDFASIVASVGSTKSLILNRVIEYDKRYLLTEDADIESFYINYYSDTQTSIMPKIKILDTEVDNSLEVSSTVSMNSNTGGSPPLFDGERYILNDGTTSIFRKGKKQIELTPEMTANVNFFLNKSQEDRIEVRDVIDDVYTNAIVVLRMEKKKISLNSRFVDDKPFYNIKLDLTLTIDEVIEEDADKKLLKRIKDLLSPVLVDKIKLTLTERLNNTIDYCKENNLDLIKLYQSFYRHNNKDWEKYIEKIGFDNYLNDINYEIEINVFSED